MEGGREGGKEEEEEEEEERGRDLSFPTAVARTGLPGGGPS